MLSISEKEQIEREIMDGDFELLLDEADGLPTPRPSRSNIYKDISAPTVDNGRPLTSQTTTMSDAADLLQDIDLCLSLTQPKTPREPSVPIVFSCQDIFQHNHAGGGFFAQSKFCDMLKAEIQETYSVEITITKSKDETPLENPIYIIDFKSQDQGKPHEAQKSLRSLFTTIKMKTVDEQSGFWIKYQDCIRIFQTYSDQNEHLHVICEHSTIGLLISYFDKGKSSVLLNLCTTDATLDKIIKEKFLSLDISLPSTSDLTTINKSHLAQDILKLENQMRSHDILIILEQRRIRLFGLVDLVKEVEKQVEDIKIKYASNKVKLNLEPGQIKYLLDIHYDELKALETNYCDAEIIENLKNGEFIAPSYLHNTIEEQIMVLATLCTPIYFEIQEEAFCLIAHNECSKLINIGRQHKCQIEIEENITNHICKIPKATTQDHISNKLTAAAIKIHIDDLAEQKVDLVVICSTSMYLCEDILEKAGQSVQQEYAEAAETSLLEPFETNAGHLRCRKLLFLPWLINQTSTEAFYQSIRNFVSQAVQHAVKAHHTSIAFPSIGCGKLHVDKNIVANEMLVEAQKQLLTANVLLQIIFVILPDQIDVFEAFEAKLESLQKGNVETKDIQIAYSLSTLMLTIISSSMKKQDECKKALDDYVQKKIDVREYFQELRLKKWTQPAINAFYRFCLGRSVILDMDINIGYMKLYGSKDSVVEAENEYLREQAKQSEQARLEAIARNIIWAYKIKDNNWEKYSPELNAHIEDAHSSQVPSFNYADDKSRECTINFKTMTETCKNNPQQREIIRHANFELPQYWEVQSRNVEQFPVSVNSAEYNEIVTLFNQAMANKYTEIRRIDRIQNKPWYMQYNSYKSFSPKRDTEKRLFHGCPQQSAALIIHSFFNRSFAGINGTVYGQGAYFSTNASYSHGYTRANPSNDGERCMFVANVLVGDSALGNTSMKTPPPGFDSTTDGNHIFVTYRDDQAYAAYLIVYK